MTTEQFRNLTTGTRVRYSPTVGGVVILSTVGTVIGKDEDTVSISWRRPRGLVIRTHLIQGGLNMESLETVEMAK